MKLLVSILVFVLLFVLYVWYLEETTIFLPSDEFYGSPKDLNLEYDDVYVESAPEIKINGWFVKRPNPQGTLIFFHGNAGNIGDRLEKISLFHQLGLNVFIVDYRGYGRSEGKSTEQGMYEDAVAAYDYVAKRDDVDPQRIIAYGASLGGAAAIDLGTKRDLDLLIVDSSFTRAADMAKVIFPFIPSFLVRTKLDSQTKIKLITSPKLFIHSRDDRTVPFAIGQKLYNAAAEPKEFLEIRGDHNEGHFISGSTYWQGIQKFLKKHQ